MFADVDAVELVTARTGRVEAADEIHQRGFAGAGRSHDGDVFAALDFEARHRAARGSISAPIW